MLKVDQVLQGRYHITRVIGHGGMGAVYEARHIELDMVCVVKEMLPSDDEDLVEILAKQFKREAKILAGLRHPSLPRVSDYFTEGGHYYLVMDLINGESLENLIKTQKLPE
ncbi:MAG TPA: protein kinase, partial [Anaerolineae bacterium]